ncbi:hypothetical protein [Streptomyces sp. NPDC047009]|uniref:hypothetical protein n=1 Tax=Streptomyces sp. NPDC047009 TaxID=3154496 RepID=UPI003406DCFE
MNRRLLYRRARAPLSLMVTVTVAAGLFAASIRPAGAGKRAVAQQREPTVVRVHGAFADSTGCNGVVKKLKRDGYPVLAEAGPLRGLRIDAAYLKDLLASIDGPIVLAVHFYGGAVISNAAYGAGNVKTAVSIDALIPDKGESAPILADRFPGSTLGDALRPVPISLPDGSKGTSF